jgi:serine/threonine-protein kinase HipA
LLITREGVRLAPCYDLVSTAVYGDLTDRLALKIGGENRPERIQKRHWQALAEISGANPRIVWQRIADLGKSVPLFAEELAPAVDLEENESETIRKILDVIGARAKHLLREA